MALRAVLVAVLLAFVAAAPAEAADPRLTELAGLAESSRDGIVALDTAAFSKFVDGTSRPYSLFVICLAKHLMDKDNLKLGDLRREFAEVASLAREMQESGPKVFFTEVEFTTDKDIFGRLGVTMLPLILHIPPGLSVPASGSAKPGDADIMSSNNFPHYPWGAEDIATFVFQRTGMDIELPEEPKLVDRWYFPYLAAGVLGGVSALLYGLYHAPFMRYPSLYLLGGLAVYWFSVSGGMYNIIRGMPMVVRKETGTQLFLQGQGQLGAEGFIMGSRYTGFGVALGLATLVAPRIKSPMGQRLLCYVCLLVAFLCLNGVITVYKWKTGYGIKTYFFKE